MDVKLHKVFGQEQESSFLTTLDLSGVENGLYRLNVVSNGIPTSIQLLKAN